jgi:hypothetical protein
VNTAPVGQFPANAFGLHDMHGNVWEWVDDVWHDSYAGAPSHESAWVRGGGQSRRALRGGSWRDSPLDLRSASRYGVTPDNRDDYTGFRIARTVRHDDRQLAQALGGIDKQREMPAHRDVRERQTQQLQESAASTVASESLPLLLEQKSLPLLSELPSEIQNEIGLIRIYFVPINLGDLIGINGGAYREKEKVDLKITLERIGRDFAIFTFRAHRFRVVYP